ncbi:SubName: Full=Uncharacterized protein {ECO:0000313/EMBL:CCA66617.1} [Serendipita indica DSM 11827]|uniref:Phosphatidylinositol N-acetylglucosaminyltransferase subunit H conserved domain-containing protein n=1 Tax=Serendipita indica (strain DSM 11827) TaxID=1109443 RepID=G4T5J0_SERID|nr:SubName: Full=Uncharacterized protein {ECO:0000313/EMBL:CCA66617.1} [Serendipita indica DSM 11827]CCA66617.1 hypothetical protein PIIN_00300 [Serendipita indica DSM 11827]
MRPLSDAHPELEIIDNLPLFIEYRVYNCSLTKDGSNRLRRRYGVSLRDVSHFSVSIYIWTVLHYPLVGGLLLVMLAHAMCTQLLWESLVVLPDLGLQIETARGISMPFFTQPLFTSRAFIPLEDIHDILINEGLHRWSWYYYLAIFQRPSSFKRNQLDLKLRLAFKDILPPLAVLRIVYHNARQILFHNVQTRGA